MSSLHVPTFRSLTIRHSSGSVHCTCTTMYSDHHTSSSASSASFSPLSLSLPPCYQLYGTCIYHTVLLQVQVQEYSKMIIAPKEGPVKINMIFVYFYEQKNPGEAKQI